MQKKHQLKNMGIVIIIVMITIFIIGCISLFIWAFSDIEFLESKDIESYTPTFKDAIKWEIVETEDGVFLFYPNDKHYSTGEKLAKYSFLTYNSIEGLTELDNHIDVVYDDYVIFELGAINTDCFGIYKDSEQVTRFKYESLMAYITPSDRWLCNDYEMDVAGIVISTIKRSPEYFRERVDEDMSYDEMIDIFGEPDSDIGSGLYIPVYYLQDFSSIHFGFSNKNKILYVLHLHPAKGIKEYFIDNQESNSIIPDNPYSCESDNDCIAIQKGCCNCMNGGYNTAINKKYKTDWEIKLEKECTDEIACSTVVNLCPDKAVCNEGRCELDDL